MQKSLSIIWDPMLSVELLAHGALHSVVYS
jgi:hypothetical protein